MKTNDVSTAKNDGNKDDLATQITAYDKDRGYSTVTLLKEGPVERTELVRDVTGCLFVRKYLRVPQSQQQVYDRISHLHAPYLPRIVDVSYFGDTLVVVSEYIEGVSLREYVSRHGPLDHASCCRLMDCLAKAADALHHAPGASVIHRDINPGNIIVHDNCAYLIDFGIAREVNEQAMHDTHILGTAGYAAPEQFGFAQSDSRTDIFALGMVLRFMSTGLEPDQAGEAPSFAQAAVEKATAIDPRDRYRTARALVAATRGGANAFSTKMRKTPALRICWRIWQTLCGFAAGIATLVFAIDALHFESPQRTVFDIVFCIFWFLIPLVLLSNFADYANRIPWFVRHRYRRIALALAISFAIAILYALLAYVFEFYPDTFH